MSSGFSRVPNSGEFRTQTSWGRTRSPKNILSSARAGTGSDGNAYCFEGADTFFLATTENQRYLHIHCSGTLNAGGGSAPLLHISGAMYAASSSVHGFAHLQMPIAGQDTLAAGEYLKVEISGMDKIVITGSNFNNAGDIIEFYAACSTF